MYRCSLLYSASENGVETDQNHEQDGGQEDGGGIGIGLDEIMDAQDPELPTVPQNLQAQDQQPKLEAVVADLKEAESASVEPKKDEPVPVEVKEPQIVSVEPVEVKQPEATQVPVDSAEAPKMETSVEDVASAPTEEPKEEVAEAAFAEKQEDAPASGQKPESVAEVPEQKPVLAETSAAMDKPSSPAGGDVKKDHEEAEVKPSNLEVPTLPDAEVEKKEGLEETDVKMETDTADEKVRVCSYSRKR
jgi:hypothetical protein